MTTPGTAGISGVVVIAGSGQPARRASVNLSAADLRDRWNTVTDDQGRFSFNGLPGGRFTLSASKSGYVGVTYGQRQPGAGRAGTPIQLAEGQRAQVMLQMPRGGVISGTVLDEHGEAVPGTSIRALRRTLQGGQPRWIQAGTAATDDRGVYRIYGLEPGQYLVCAVPRNLPGVARALERLRADLTAAGAATAGSATADAVQGLPLPPHMGQPEDGSAGYAPVYYPGTPVASSASPLAIAPGEEKLGVDFQLQLLGVARIEGLVAASGIEPQRIRVNLVDADEEFPGVGSRATRPDATGTFRFTGIAPGRYVIVASAMGGGAARGAAAMTTPAARAQAAAARAADSVRLWAETEVTVDGRNVSNLVLALQPGVSVSGRIEFNGTTLPPPADLTRLRVSLNPLRRRSSNAEFAASGRVDANGRFAFQSVVPGTYRLSSSAEGWTLESASIGGQDTLDFPIAIRGTQAVTGAVITFSDQRGELSGTVANQRGEPVSEYSIVVYPADQRYWTPESRRIRSTRPATDGTFRIGSLPPGEYRIAPVLDPEPGIWFEPNFLLTLENAALRFSLAHGEKKVQNLRVATGG